MEASITQEAITTVDDGEPTFEEAFVSVPPDVPALSILCVSDTHDQQPHGTLNVSQLPHADILVHAGDFTCRGSKEEIQNFQGWTQQLLDEGVVKDVVFVSGNHECSMECKARIPAARAAQERLKEQLTQREGVHYLEDDGCEVRGLRFYGSPWTVRCGRDWAFQGLDTDEKDFGSEFVLADKFASIPPNLHILVTHQPPFGQGDGDSARKDKRTGSKMLARRIAEAQPLLHVFGHIHGGHGVTTHEGTTFVNAAICDDDYQPVQKPILVQFRHEAS